MPPIHLSREALTLLRKKYLRKTETPEQMLRRVAHFIAQPDLAYDRNADVQKTGDEFYRIMASLEFLPNSPALINAGTRNSQLASCFVLPPSYKSLAEIIHQSGGGTGFSFSGLDSGAVLPSIRHLSKENTGANMAVLRVDHPDILDFISLKKSPGALSNFNISVGVTDDFMHRVKGDKEYFLIDLETKKPLKKIKARKAFSLIAKNAWSRGDPGIVFLDEINRKNPCPAPGRIETTSACGEAPLLPYESCILGSINLPKFIPGGRIDFRRLEKTVRTAVRFLDNAIDACSYPSPEIEKAAKSCRKIGLGVMGFAVMLSLLEIPYASNKAVSLAEKTMEFIQEKAAKESEDLAREKGAFPGFRHSKRKNPTRNATFTAISPTGSRSLIAGCSPGIEPYFGQATKIPHEKQVRIQAAFQKHVDNAISKTVNLPESAKVQDVEKIFMLAWKLGCKGVTVYRDGSLPRQPIKMS